MFREVSSVVKLLILLNSFQNKYKILDQSLSELSKMQLNLKLIANTRSQVFICYIFLILKNLCSVKKKLSKY